LVARLLRFLPLVLVVVGINVGIDPGNVLGTGERERRLAEDLLAGHGVRVMSGYDEMLLQRRCAERMHRAVDVLVLGSSRSMTVSAASFPGRSLWNGSVSSAAIEDYIAIEQVFEDRGLRPHAVLIGLDPWVLSASLRNSSVALDAELQRGLKRIGLGVAAERGALPPARSARSRYLELFSPAYFQASLSVLASGGWASLRRGRPHAGGEPRTSMVAAGNLIHPDGSLDWGPRLEDRTAEEVRRIARSHAARPPAYLLATELRPERRRLLEAFVSRLRRDGVTVVFWFAPFHPDAYQGLRASQPTSVIEAAEAAFRVLAASHGVSVIGSFDPAGAGARPEDFVDEHHARRVATLRLLGASGLSALPPAP
jgi:hypothetical protein